MEDKKKNIYTGIGLAIGFLAYFAIKSVFFGAPTIEKQNMLIANEINKSCPVMVDANTRLDNLIAQPDNTLAYNYTLINLLKDSLNPEAIESSIRPVMIQTIKTHPDMEFQRKNKTTLSYNYRDKTGVHVLQFEIGPNDYED